MQGGKGKKSVMYVCMFTAFVKPVGFQGRGTNWCLTITNQKRAAKKNPHQTTSTLNAQSDLGHSDIP